MKGKRGKEKQLTSTTRVIHAEERNDGVDDEKAEGAVLRNQGRQGLDELALLVCGREGREGEGKERKERKK